jgi:hypothetical protein
VLHQPQGKQAYCAARGDMRSLFSVAACSASSSDRSPDR